MKKQRVTKKLVDAAVAIQSPQKRCHLCPDGGEGKPLVEVVGAADRMKKWACVQHAAFFARERTGVNRKYLPGNSTPPVVEKEEKREPIEIAPDAGVEPPRPKIKVRDRR